MENPSTEHQLEVTERQGESSEFGPVTSWNHAVGAIKKLATISR